MNDKVIWQVMDMLRGSVHMRSEGALECALQLIVWVLLSRRGAIAPELRFTERHLNDFNLVISTLESLSESDALYSIAYPNIRKRFEPEAARLLQALHVIQDLADKGVLEQVSAPDALLLVDQHRSAYAGIPTEIADLMIGLCELYPSGGFYAPWDFGAQLTSRAATQTVLSYVEVPSFGAVTALVAMLGGQKTQVRVTDPITKPSAIAQGRPTKFDASASFPPIGYRYPSDTAENDLYGRFPETTTSGTVLAIRHLIAQTARRSVVAVPGSLLFAEGPEANLRTNLLANRQVRAVISMPAGMLTNTNIPFSILILDLESPCEQIRFVDANSATFKEPRLKFRTRLVNGDQLARLALGNLESQDAIDVPVQDVLNNGANLLPARYLRNEDELAIERLLESSRTVKLSAAATTVRPLALKKDDGTFEVYEIGAADLPEFGYIRQPPTTVKVDKETILRNEKQFLRPLDIVLIIKGSAGKVGIVPDDAPPPGEGGWIAGLSALIVRVDPKGPIDPRALFLQWRKHGKSILNRATSGGTIPMIKTSELNNLPIIVPDRETGEQISNALSVEAWLQSEIETLREKQAAAAESIWSID